MLSSKTAYALDLKNLLTSQRLSVAEEAFEDVLDVNLCYCHEFLYWSRRAFKRHISTSNLQSPKLPLGTMKSRYTGFTPPSSPLTSSALPRGV